MTQESPLSPEFSAVSYYLDILYEARNKGLTVVVDEYTPEFRLQTASRKVVGNAKTLLELHELVDAYVVQA